MKKQRLIIKIIFVLFAIVPYLILEPFGFYTDIVLWFFGFYFLINIFLCLQKKDLKYAKYILNVLDGFIIFFFIAAIIFSFFIARTNMGDAGLLFLFYPALGTIFVFGVVSLYLTNSK